MMVEIEFVVPVVAIELIGRRFRLFLPLFLGWIIRISHGGQEKTCACFSFQQFLVEIDDDLRPLFMEFGKGDLILKGNLPKIRA